MSKPKRLPSGNWRIQWLDHAGKRRSATFATEAAAKAGLRRALVQRDDVRTGRAAAPATTPLFKALVEEFMASYVAANNKPSERDSKDRSFRLYLLPEFGELRVDEIGLKEIEALKAKLLAPRPMADGGPPRPALSPKTINNALVVLGTCLRYAKETGALVGELPRIKALKLPPQDFDFLDFDELERLLATAAGSPELRAAILVAGEAGLRSGEIRALQWDDVDLVARRLRVARGEYRGKIGTPKGGRARTVDMTQRLTEALKAIRHLRGALVFCYGDGFAKQPWITEAAKPGAMLTERAMTTRLAATCKRAGLRSIGWHVLRHTFCSHLAMRGAPAKAIQELAGHASLSTTQRYMHLSPAATRSAIDLLEQPAAGHDLGAGSAGTGRAEFR